MGKAIRDIKGKKVTIFIDKIEGFEYCKDKVKEDKDYFNDKIKAETDADLEFAFYQWKELKKHSFSPAEYSALAKDGPTKDAIVSSFVDWAEGRPRRQAIIIVADDKKAKATDYALKVDPIGGKNTFTQGLSKDGKEPATHWMCSWNCSAREYEFFEVVEGEKDWDLYDGEVISWQKVLISRGLEKIVETRV